MKLVNKKSASFLMLGLLSAMLSGSVMAQVNTSSTVNVAPSVANNIPNVANNIKNVTADKSIAVDNPIKMTETMNKRFEDKEKILNAKKVAVVNESNKVTNGTVVNLTDPKKVVVGTNGVAVVEKTEKVEEKKKERVLMKESDIVEKVGMTNHNIEKLGSVNSRLEYVNQLKLLKQAEFDLLQPPEDKNAEKEKKVEAVKEPTLPYNPVGNVNFGNANMAQPKVEVVDAGPDFSNVSVYSIIGFEGKYSAKVSLDGQSVYTINKGDTLPNGSIVTDITRYYIVVAERSAVGRPLSEPQRVYATGKPLASTGGGQSVSLTSSSTPTSLPNSPDGTMVVPSRR